MFRVDPAVHRRSLERVSRRLFLRGTLSIGALSLLSGCNLEDDDAVDRVLSAMSRWNDTVQAALFSSARMAPTYTEFDITDPFPFNAYYPFDQVRHVDGGSWRLEVSGLVSANVGFVGAGRAGRAAADRSDHAPHLHRRLERDRRLGRRAIPRPSSRASGPTPRTTVRRRSRCADRYYSQLDGHGDGAASGRRCWRWTFGAGPVPMQLTGTPRSCACRRSWGSRNPKHIAAIVVSNAQPGRLLPGRTRAGKTGWR